MENKDLERYHNEILSYENIKIMFPKLMRKKLLTHSKKNG